MMSTVFSPNSGNPVGKLADVELHFGEGHPADAIDEIARLLVEHADDTLNT